VTPKPPVKAGTSKSAAAKRCQAFINAYLTNGRNGTQAAISAGCPPAGAAVQAARWLKDDKIAAQVAERTLEVQAISGLTAERTLQEIGRLAYFDSRKLFRADGSMVPVHEMDDDTAAAVASVEHEDITLKEGENARVIGSTKKLKLHSKTAALEMAMRHLGLYEKDNRQRGPDLALQVVLMGPE
jgi:phage terminase small subunit